MKALVGKKAGGADCYLDIHEKYHGPHGLIAGTTVRVKVSLFRHLCFRLQSISAPMMLPFL